VAYFSDLGSFLYDDDFAPLSEYLLGRQVVVIADQRTHGFCLQVASKFVKPLQSASLVVIPAGDQHKTSQIAEYIIGELVQVQANKQTVLVSLGGGMVTDITAYVASVYMRGLSLVHIPTSLLAMVDAAIGGKTALNFGGIKNLIGTYHFPKFIWFHTIFLKSLPERDHFSGLAEIIKHAMIADASLWAKSVRYTGLEDFALDLAESHRVKCALVLQDKNDAAARQQLNWGHSIGHALEAATSNSGYPLLHGEAIVLGMYAELIISEQVLQCDSEIRAKLSDLLKQHYSHLYIDKFVTPDQLISKLFFDKKNSEGIQMSLLRAIGDCKVGVKVSLEVVRNSIEQLLYLYGR
jgi:3-dehydroquinate synthase